MTLVGPTGSGKSSLVSAVADKARRDGFEVFGASPVFGQPGRLVWAQLLGDVGAGPAITTAVMSAEEPLEASVVVRQLLSDHKRLIVVDDIDTGGQDAIELLGLLAGRLVASSTAVVASSRSPLGVGPELTLGGLSEDDLEVVVGELGADERHAVWVASRGLPGAARALGRQLHDLPNGREPFVHLALNAVPRLEFLAVDDGLVRLYERALALNPDDGTRARLLARMARDLLGDPLAGARRQALMDEALTLGRRGGDPQTLVEVLDARLHALWGPDGAADRLSGSTEIIALASLIGDEGRHRSGLFWRFVALMEFARVDEAEIVLGAFERAAFAAGDADASVMALSRHAMLATLRGQFDVANALIEQVAEQARRAGLPDADRLSRALRGGVLAERGDDASAQDALATLMEVSRRLPGHFYETTAARILVEVGRLPEAAALLDRMLAPALAASGPRWLGAITELCAVAAGTGDTSAAARLYDAVLPYQGRLVVWGGANATNGPASYYLGLLATQLGRWDEAIGHLTDAIGLAESIGALPALAHSLVALSAALSVRAGPGDIDRAADLIARASDLAERLGLVRLGQRLEAGAREWALRSDGDGWVLEAGDERVRLPDSRGVLHLRALLAAPRADIAALDLAAGGRGLEPEGAAPLLDNAALASYRRRLELLTAELDGADAAGDAERAWRADAERQALLAELRRATGLGGRARRTTAESERARVNVTRTLQAVLRRIDAGAPKAGTHLRASIRTGLACRYDPVPGGPERWHV